MSEKADIDIFEDDENEINQEWNNLFIQTDFVRFKEPEIVQELTPFGFNLQDHELNQLNIFKET